MGIPAAELEGGVGYPRDRIELDEFFPDEASCWAYLERLRWADSFVCPRCGWVGEPWRSSDGRTVLTDGWSGYTDLSARGSDHLVINQSASPDPAHVLLPGPHGVVSLVKRWLLGTYQGGVANAQILYYSVRLVTLGHRLRDRRSASPHEFFPWLDRPVRRVASLDTR